VYIDKQGQTYIDGEPVQGLTLQEAVERMRGKVGTPIKLSIRRGAKDPFAGRTYSVTAAVPGTGGSQSFVIPYLDLSDKPVQVVYDRKLETYPASYVSLYFPATMEMGMGTGQVMGEMPPLWAIPNNARESAMIKKLNVKAGDQFAYGTPPMHPEDKGVTLTDEERLHLIRSIDVGGQYYARQNTGFIPFAGDPVAPGMKY
jgi:hypothetical protein